MKITKKTLSTFEKLTRITKDNYNPQLDVIVEVLKSGGAICGNAEEGFDICDTTLPVVGLIHGDYSRHIASGMGIRYPQYIQTTLTHGNNQVAIVGDINKLVKAIVQ